MFDLTANPRTVSEKDFPLTGTPTEQLHFILNYAVLAPSEYNTQPWLFRVQGRTVELYADSSRRLPSVDPDNRELTISCGAAFLNLCIALRHFGYREEVEIYAQPDPPDLFARLHLVRRYQATEEEHRLFSAIGKRRTNRMAFEQREVPPSLLSTLGRMAGYEATKLCLLQDDATRQAVLDLIATGDRLQWAESTFRHELAAWVRHDNDSPDGLPVSAHAKGSRAAAVSPLVVRTVNLGNGEAAKDRQLAASSPVLAILTTYADTWGDWFATGQAVERMLLCACAEGVQASFVNQPIEIPHLRTELRTLLGQPGFPQLVLRLGYGSEVPATPRRSVSDVLL